MFLCFLIKISILFGLNSYQSLDEIIGFCLCETKWWQQAQDVLTGTTGKAVLMLDKRFTNHSVWHVEFDANHKSATTNLFDM